MRPSNGADAMVKPEPHSPNSGRMAPSANTEATELRLRLDALKADLGDAVAGDRAKAEASRNKGTSNGALGVGLRAGSDLAAGVLVGCGIGYLLDRQFGTSPLFLIVFMMIGMAAGFWNVYRLGVRGSGPRDRNTK